MKNLSLRGFEEAVVISCIVHMVGDRHVTFGSYELTRIYNP